MKFLCGGRRFNEQHIRNDCKKIMKTRPTSTHGRLDSFKVPTGVSNKSNKRKTDPVNETSQPKKMRDEKTSNNDSNNNETSAKKRKSSETAENGSKPKKMSFGEEKPT